MIRRPYWLQQPHPLVNDRSKVALHSQKKNEIENPNRRVDDTD